MDLTEYEKNHNTQRHPWELARINVIKTILKKAGIQNNQNSNIIDIGCGDVFVASELCKKYTDTNILANDINFTQQQINNLKTANINLPNLHIDNNLDTFLNSSNNTQAVLLLDVIEHIEHDIDFLKQLKNKFGNNVKFVITVPAFNKLFSQHDTFLGHYRRYNRKQLINNCKKAGFEVTKCNYFFTSLLLPRLLAKISDKILDNKSNNQGVSNWNKGKLLSFLVKTALIADFKITNLLNNILIRIPGLSIYCLCQPAA